MRFTYTTPASQERSIDSLIAHATLACEANTSVYGVEPATPLWKLWCYDAVKGSVSDYIDRSGNIDTMNTMMLNIKAPHQIGHLSNR